MFITLSPFQHFNLSAFLSRKRVQNYCFTAYVPNIPASFFQRKCDFSPKLLILKRCRAAYFLCTSFCASLPYLNIYHARVYKEIRRNCLHSCHRKATACVTARNRWQQTATSPCTRCTKACPGIQLGFLKTSTNSADENKEFPAKPVKIIVYGLPPEDVASYRCKM